MSVSPDRPLRQILPQRVVFDQSWFGTAERPEDLLVTIQPGQVGVVVAVDAEDPQVALVQAEVVTRAGPQMVMVFTDWKILIPESIPTMPGARAQFNIPLGDPTDN